MNTIPTVTKNLLIINVLIFLGTVVAQSYGIDLNQYLGLHFFLAGDFNAAQLITYMFMHGGFTHLFFNMFAVWMFGRILEQVWGPKRRHAIPQSTHVYLPAAFPHQSQIFCHRIRLDRIIFRLCQQSGRQRRTLCALGRHDIRFYTNNVLEKKEQRKWLLL